MVGSIFSACLTFRTVRTRIVLDVMIPPCMKHLAAGKPGKPVPFPC